MAAINGEIAKRLTGGMQNIRQLYLSVEAMNVATLGHITQLLVGWGSKLERARVRLIIDRQLETSKAMIYNIHRLLLACSFMPRLCSLHCEVPSFMVEQLENLPALKRLKEFHLFNLETVEID